MASTGLCVSTRRVVLPGADAEHNPAAAPPDRFRGLYKALLAVSGVVDEVNALATGQFGDFGGDVIAHLVASNYREGCAVAPIVIESTPASEQLSYAARRAFQDLITTLAARLTEKGIPDARAARLATNVWTSVEGALILSRVLRSPEPFDQAIALLTAAADQVDSDR
jgi:hypothetical protein